MTSSTVQHIVFDVCDPQRVAAFWSQALDRPIQDDWGDFVRLSPDNAGTRIAFAGVPEPRVGKNRLHIDLNTENRERTVAELVTLGGSVIDTRTAAQHTWTVMADPEGNEFCVG
ncbi:MAG: VOC family protein [Actinobacteria bacterium]|nr:VOC family protein [Actinomycetota bacterium]